MKKSVKNFWFVIYILGVILFFISCSSDKKNNGEESEAFIIDGTVVKVLDFLFPSAYAKDTTDFIAGCTPCSDTNSCASLYVVHDSFDRTLVCQTSINSVGFFKFDFPSQPTVLKGNVITQIEAITSTKVRNYSTPIGNTSKRGLILTAEESMNSTAILHDLITLRSQDTLDWQNYKESELVSLVSDSKVRYPALQLYTALDTLFVINGFSSLEEFFNNPYSSRGSTQYCLLSMMTSIDDYLSLHNMGLNQISSTDEIPFYDFVKTQDPYIRICFSYLQFYFLGGNNNFNTVPFPDNAPPSIHANTTTTPNGTPVDITIYVWDPEGDDVTYDISGFQGSATISNRIETNSFITFTFTPLVSNAIVSPNVTIDDGHGNQSIVGASVVIGTGGGGR
ncbi:MAG: hypothetical protein KBD63_05570 [Bacteriovoracaceae bacterium]|nr:hypothetical protein [Bacteriovoracaceae bacterium]